MSVTQTLQLGTSLFLRILRNISELIFADHPLDSAFKGTVIQIEKVLINNSLRVSEAS